NEPLAPGRFGGANDGREIKVPVTDFGIGHFALVRHEVILQVKERQTPRELRAPADRISPAELDPVGVEFSLEVFRIGPFENTIQDELSAEAAEFVVVI